MGYDSILDSLLSGSASCAFTTIIYQPLELLKTRIQLKGGQTSRDQLIGRTFRSAAILVRENGFKYLWRGTGPSLVRSVPGVGLYYSSLNLFQTNFSGQDHEPDGPAQAFYFGLISRSLVSFLLLPVTVVKVRYESGHYNYNSLFQAITEAYRRGWVGVMPTIARDSLFSGIYYMSFISLKSQTKQEKSVHSITFVNGIISGLLASIVTNPFDVIKTRMQVEESPKTSTIGSVVANILKDDKGYRRFFDGLVPRSIRRTLIAASTWTFYEILMELLKQQ